jgi:hypothetical protein
MLDQKLFERLFVFRLKFKIGFLQMKWFLIKNVGGINKILSIYYSCGAYEADLRPGTGHQWSLKVA